MGMGRTALPFFAEEGKDFGEGVVLSSGLGLSVAADQATEGTPQRTKVPHTARADFALLAYQRAAIAPRERATCHTRHKVLDPALVREERSITQRPELDVRTQCRLGEGAQICQAIRLGYGSEEHSAIRKDALTMPPQEGEALAKELSSLGTCFGRQRCGERRSGIETQQGAIHPTQLSLGVLSRIDSAGAECELLCRSRCSLGSHTFYF